MDPADATQLYGLLFTLVLPVAGVATLAFLGRRFWPHLPVLGLAVVGAGTIAWLGIAGLPNGSQNAAHYAIMIALPVGLIASFLGERPLLQIATAGLGLAAGLYLCLTPLAKVWEPNAYAALADSWIFDAGLMGLVTLSALSYAASRAPASVVLGPLALAFAAGAGVCVLSHSALLGQLLGGVGIVIGVAALLGWWKSDLKPGGIAFGVLVLTLLLVFGHFTTQVPRSAGALLVLTPAVALVGLRFERTLVAVLVVGTLAAAPAGLAVWLTQQKSEAAKTPDPNGVPEIDYGSLYGG